MVRKILFDKDNENRPYLAVNAVFLKRINNKVYVLLGKRKNVAGAGYYYSPGGHVKVDEKLSETLVREMKEECGVDVKIGKYLWTEEAMKPLHHVILYYETIITEKKGEPINVEPTKCEGWQWFSLDKLPHPIWHDLEKLLKQNKVLLQTLV